MERRGILLVAVLALVCAAANLTKAVHVDDAAYLEVAEAILADPLHAMTAEVSWYDTAEPVHRINQPHLFFYLLAAVLGLGGSELALHLLMAAISALTLLAFHGLAHALARAHAALLTALFALGPAFLPGQNLMVDAPLVGLWCLFFWCLLAGRRRHDAVAAAAAAAACLIKYVSLVLLPIFVVVLAVRREWRRVLLLCVPLGALAAWSLFNLHDYGRVHLLDRPVDPMEPARIGARSLEWLVGLGAVAPFGALLLPWLPRRTLLTWAALAVLVAGSTAVVLGLPPRAPTSFRVLGALFAANGSLLVGCVATDLVRRARSALRAGEAASLAVDAALLLWIFAAAAFVILFAPFVAVRHVLLSVPPLLLALGRGAGRIGPRRAAAALAATACLGVALAVSDLRWADVYRAQAPRIAAALPPDARIFYLGHWGWQWYARAAGMIQYDPERSRLGPGDYLVVPRSVHPPTVPPRHSTRLRATGRVAVAADASVWLRTISREPAGGYYGFSLATRSIPWHLSREPLEVFHIYVVAR
jgi:hypothetical protein